MKVLVVDDEAMICEWLQFCISQNPSCQLTGVAHNGQEALELFHRDEPDLILTDIKSSGKQGKGSGINGLFRFQPGSSGSARWSV